MATFKELPVLYDFSDSNERQVFWASMLSFTRTSPWGGSGGFTYSLGQILKSNGTALDPNGQVVFNNMQFGLHKSSVNLTSYAADESRDIGTALTSDEIKDVVLLIETTKASTIYNYVFETNRSDFYNIKAFKSHTKQEFLDLYSDYLTIKSIKLYAGKTNLRQLINTISSSGTNRLSFFIKTMMVNSDWVRAGNNFWNVDDSYKNVDLCLTVDLTQFINNPFLLQNLTKATNTNDLYIGVADSSQNNSIVTDNLIVYGNDPRILFKNKDVLNDYLNLFQIPFTYDVNKALTTPVEDLDDGYKPYDPTPGGSSKPGGGGGKFDEKSDVINIPNTPTTTAIRTDFITVWNPTIEEIQQLAEKLWSTNLITQAINNFLKVGIDAIVGLYTIPLSPQLSQLKHSIYFGNVDSEVDAYQVVNQFAEFDCGSLKVEEYWGNALDYSPYTKIELFLPFIGMVSLNPDDVMNKTVGIKYKCDVVSGACIAFISIDGSVLYTYQGNCITNIPVTSQNFSQMTSALITAGVNVGGAIATGGATALASAGLMSATSVLTTKAPIQHSGSLTGSSGMMGVRIPYLVITRPVQSIPKNYNNYKGYPSNITATLGELSGYTEVEYIHLEGFDNATAEELDKIEQALKEGVVI